MFFRPLSSWRAGSALVVLLTGFGFSAGQHVALAQSRAITDIVHVRVFQKDAGTCYYQLLDKDMAPLADQENFRIKPRATVHFMAQDVDAQVFAEPDTIRAHENFGKRPFSGSPANSSFFLDEDSGRTKGVTVRNSNGHVSNHKINVSCLVADDAIISMPNTGPSDTVGGFAHSVSIPAVPVETSTAVSGNETGAVQTDTFRKRRASGGPGMEVEDP